MKTFPLGWGNARTIRSAFLDTIPLPLVTFGKDSLQEMDYTDHVGNPLLVRQTKKIIKRQTGLDFDHVVLTTGATGAVSVALRAYAQKGCTVAITRRPPYFPIYPSMVDMAGLRHLTTGCTLYPSDEAVALIDNPANPLGSMGVIPNVSMPVIQDAVYGNSVYTPKGFKPIPSDVLIGSYSKLTGISGIRVGWIATNDSLLFERLKELVTASYCGLDQPSTTILLQLLAQLDDDKWGEFEKKARRNLDSNRTEWSKLEKFFSGTPVIDVGMFAYMPIDSACKKLLDKSGIIWTTGSSLGATDDFGRFNLGQDVDLVKKAVKTILKNDKI